MANIVIESKTKGISSIMEMQVFRDAQLMAKFLNIKHKFKIYLSRNGHGGFATSYNSKGKHHNLIRLGVKFGYCRHTLVHEILHIKGFSHGKKNKGALLMNSIGRQKDTFTTAYQIAVFGNICQNTYKLVNVDSVSIDEKNLIEL